MQEKKCGLGFDCSAMMCQPGLKAEQCENYESCKKESNPVWGSLESFVSSLDSNSYYPVRLRRCFTPEREYNWSYRWEGRNIEENLSPALTFGEICTPELFNTYFRYTPEQITSIRHDYDYPRRNTVVVTVSFRNGQNCMLHLTPEQAQELRSWWDRNRHT